MYLTCAAGVRLAYSPQQSMIQVRLSDGVGQVAVEHLS